jgi:hypothetical protein
MKRLGVFDIRSSPLPGEAICNSSGFPHFKLPENRKYPRGDRLAICQKCGSAAARFYCFFSTSCTLTNGSILGFIAAMKAFSRTLPTAAQE